jgi:hypothetical protein
MTVETRDLLVIPSREAGEGSPSIRQRRGSLAALGMTDDNEIAAELNLIGSRVDDALEASDKFLDRALLEGKQAVRIIHGFGTGTLGTSSGSTHSGIRSFNARGPVGAQQTGGLLNAQPVIGGAGYLFTGWRNRESWADANVTIWLGYFDAAEQSLGTSNDAGPYYGRLYWPAGLAPDAWVQRAVGIVTPPTCVHVNLTILSDGGGSDWIDDISLIGPKPGAAGLDVLDVSWKSLG